MALVLRFLKPYRGQLAVICLLLMVDVAGTLAIPTLAASILNQGAEAGSVGLLTLTAAQMGAFALVTGVATTAAAYMTSLVSTKMARDMRMALYAKTLKLSVFDFRSFGTASITTRTGADITTIQTMTTQAILMIVPVPIMVVFSLALTFSVDWMAGWILLAACAVILVAVALIMGTVAPLFQRLQKQLDAMGAVLLENLTGVRVVRAFNMEHHENDRLNGSFADYARTAIKANMIFCNVDGLQYVVMNAFIIAVYWTSGARIAAGSLGIGDITALVEYSIMVLMYILMAQFVVIMMPKALECCHRIEEVLEADPEIVDKPDPVVELPTTGDGDVLVFDHVDFRYPDAQEDTLQDLTFACAPGTTTAIIGGTGSGKSTIANLIMRFNEVSGGSIRLSDVDVRDLAQDTLRAAVGYVQQKAWLASGTIASNLRWAKADATDGELWHALEVAQAADFVASQEGGLEAQVAQGGTNFSGGQRQRLSIARALVRHPRLYVFDDSFSALDFKTDRALRRALAQETGDAAVLIIAQRVSSIRHADQILVIDEGRTAGLGTHDELMETCGVYREIVDSQTRKEA